MKLVIDIPEDQYTTLNAKTQDDIVDVIDHGALIKAIKNGTPLPKGHGRLIDADDVKENHRKWIGYLDEDMIARLNIAIDKYVPTIIEADKGEQEGQKVIQDLTKEED